ncbi:glycosyltransferase [Subtercola endophyticus]|uniref:glycosyltransferase n=1 Tax=Subtercola endophyticus TaxID=2895559 RepID=UPI001E3381FF|nr:glycosyltransferase [Subtercola endophyticus]UFS57742.1 glycosyltransferase [Subtercola endophyticus]
MPPALYDTLTPEAPSAATVAALGRRLVSAAEHILPPSEQAGIPSLLSRGVGVLADSVFRHVQISRSDDELWLALVALTAAFPHSDVFLACRRALGVATPERALAAVFESVQAAFRHFDSLDSDITIVTDRVVVDVDFCAKYDHNSGVQRVVRETMSRWAVSHDIELCCWSTGDNALRELSPVERRRVVDWNAWKLIAEADRPAEPPTFRPRIVVPFGTTVILPEVARQGYAPALACLAEFSSNRVGMVGYDTVPIVSADLVAENESEMFGRYLTAVKHADRIASVSASAGAEFEGFLHAAAAQNLPTAAVRPVPLAIEVPQRSNAAAGSKGSGAEPLVLMVGNQEARKNNLAVIFAAETLWREGLRFRLRMIGGGKSQYTRLIDRYVARLTRLGRPIELWRGASDDLLVDSYGSARFTVFPSLHEGFGLPAAESLAMGIPTVTSNYGSTAEIAAGGGALTVDPRDDRQLVEAFRALLTDEALHDRLVAEALARPSRSWDDYAAELWSELVVPLERDV